MQPLWKRKLSKKHLPSRQAFSHEPAVPAPSIGGGGHRSFRGAMGVCGWGQPYVAIASPPCTPHPAGMPRCVATRLIAAFSLFLVALGFNAHPANAAGVISTITVGSTPMGIALTPDGSKAYVTNSASGTVSVIDTATLAVTSTITTGGQPVAIAMSPDGSQVFVADYLNGTYKVIATASDTVVGTAPKPSFCDNPTSIAYHPTGSPIYSGCGLRVFAINTSTPYANSQVRHGSNSIEDVAVSGDASELIDAGGGYVVFVNSGWSAGVSNNPRAVAITYDGDTAYSANADGTVTSLYRPTTTIASWAVGTDLSDIVLREGDDRIYVTDRSANQLIIQELSTRTTLSTFAVGSTPSALAVSSDGTRAYVVNSASNSVSVIDLTDGSSSSGGSQAVTYTLNLSAGEGASCAPSEVSGRQNNWVTLPEAGACTNTTRSGASVLLGFATTPDFPVDIAQRQVTNGWGAYELFNARGEITSVFIPVGGATLMTGTRTMYAIWGSS